MFSLQPSDELVFGTPTCEDPTIYHALRSEPNLINFSTDHKRVNSGGLTRQNDDERDQSINSKKVVHREVERKRRKQMSDLHLTLASLLPTPIQQNKGKRPVCNQMQEAANYIKNMENKIEELRIRRDRLTKSSDNYKVVISSTSSESSDDGMEILIKSGDDYYGISRVLEALAEMEVDVVNCLSTRIRNPPGGGGFLHKIQIQGRDMKSLDVSVLQHKLTNSIK